MKTVEPGAWEAGRMRAYDRLDDPVQRKSRIWTHPDGRRFNVVMESPARHLVRVGKLAWSLTFVPVGGPGRQTVRGVPPSFDLERATDVELRALLEPSAP